MGVPRSQLSFDSGHQRAVAVVPSDTVNFTQGASRVYVGGTGNVVCITSRGDVVTFTGVPAGTTLPVQIRRVNSTSTTATNMVALYG